MQKILFVILNLVIVAQLNLVLSQVDAKQRKDVAIFRKVILAKESKLDIHNNKDSVLFYFDKLDSDLSENLSSIDQFKYFGKALSKIYSGHTQIQPNKEIYREWLSSRNSLPLDFYLIGKRLVTNKLLAEDLTIINEGKSKFQRKKKVISGTEILSIDGKTVAAMMNEIGEFLSSDENSIDFKYFQAAQLFEFYRHIALPFDKDSIEVTFLSLSGDTSSLYFLTGTAPVHTINKRLDKSERLYQKNESNLGEFAIVNRKGFFRFRSFSMSVGSKYEAFLERSFKKLKARNIDELIIDLRGNMGGVMQYSFMRYIVGEDVNLGKYIVGKPKKGFENSHIKKFDSGYFKHRAISKKQARLKRLGKFNGGIVKTKAVDTSLIFHGNIIVITDEGTFSAAAILASNLKSLVDAKIIGRRAGGSFYKGNAGTILLKLPKSKLQLFINPNSFYSQLEEVEDPLLIKEPDLYLHPLIIDNKKRDMYYLREGVKAFSLFK
ncbi:MAG: hypothetical protein COA33_012515 [Fluviicola sp.]|nr:hypothetical protein [Fluviicola sp.]